MASLLGRFLSDFSSARVRMWMVMSCVKSSLSPSRIAGSSEISTVVLISTWYKIFGCKRRPSGRLGDGGGVSLSLSVLPTADNQEKTQ